jgi:hypothetical protein
MEIHGPPWREKMFGESQNIVMLIVPIADMG